MPWHSPVKFQILILGVQLYSVPAVTKIWSPGVIYWPLGLISILPEKKAGPPVIAAIKGLKPAITFCPRMDKIWKWPTVNQQSHAWCTWEETFWVFPKCPTPRLLGPAGGKWREWKGRTGPCNEEGDRSSVSSWSFDLTRQSRHRGDFRH